MCHPFMHALSLARVIHGKNGGVSGVASGEELIEGREGGTLHGWMLRCTM